MHDRAHASRCELANAHVKARLDVDHILVCGTMKVACVVRLASLAFNLLQQANAFIA